MKNKEIRERSIAVFVRALLGTAVGCICTAQAADFGATIDVGVGYSDNIDTAPDDLAIEEKMGTVGLNLLYFEDTRRFDADVLADVMYVDYLDNTFDNDVIGNARGDVTLGLMPERFQWQISDNFGQIRTNRFSPVSPTNRENINVFSTGPDLLFRLGARNGVRLSARYGRTDFETSVQDEESRRGSIALTRELSGGSTAALIGETAQYDFTQATFADFDRHNLYLNYETAGARTTLGVDVGYTIVDFGDEDSDGVLGRLRLTRRVSAASTIAFGLGTSFSASGDVFRNTQRRLSGRDDAQLTLAVSDVFWRRSVDVGWTFARARTALTLTVLYSNDTYEHQTDFNRELMVTSLEVRRELGRNSSFDLGARYNDEEFDSGIDSKTLRLSAGFAWQVGQHIVLSLRGIRYDRSSHQVNTQYEENQGWFTVGYRMGQSQ